MDIKACKTKGLEEYFEDSPMANDTSVSASLIESATHVLLRVVFAFEPLAPTGITILVNQQLHKFKESGAIGDYKTKTKRLGKFHYRIELDLDVTGHAGGSSSQ